MKLKVMSICVLCTLQGMAYEWTEEDDVSLVRPYSLMINSYPQPPPNIHEFIKEYYPDVTDIEMV